MIGSLSIRVGIAAIVMGIVLGFVPAYTADLGEFGDSVSCGSPFIVSDNLTGSGLDACEGAGGLSTRRAWAIALIAGGLVFLAAAIIKDIQHDNTTITNALDDQDHDDGEGDGGYLDDPSSRYS